MSTCGGSLLLSRTSTLQLLYLADGPGAGVWNFSQSRSCAPQKGHSSVLLVHSGAPLVLAGTGCWSPFSFSWTLRLDCAGWAVDLGGLKVAVLEGCVGLSLWAKLYSVWKGKGCCSTLGWRGSGFLHWGCPGWCRGTGRGLILWIVWGGLECEFSLWMGWGGPGLHPNELGVVFCIMEEALLSIWFDIWLGFPQYEHPQSPDPLSAPLVTSQTDSLQEKALLVLTDGHCDPKHHSSLQKFHLLPTLEYFAHQLPELSLATGLKFLLFSEQCPIARWFWVGPEGSLWGYHSEVESTCCSHWNQVES